MLGSGDEVRNRHEKKALISRGMVFASAMVLAACAQTPDPGEEIGACGPEYRIRAKQLSLPATEPGVATVEITTSDRYEIIPGIQVGLESPTGRFYQEKLPRSYAYTDSRGKLRVEWHADAGRAERTVLTFYALDFPGECSVELAVDPQR